MHGTSVVQVPPMHVSVAAQRMPQRPQFIASVAVLMQAPAQQPRPSGQPAPAPQRQTPSEHTSSSRHAGVHDAVTHALSSHAIPSAHGTPHAPQSAGELVRSAHRPPQQVSPPTQGGPEPQVHSESAQMLPAGKQL
jgi:hypothetical protein